MRKAVVALFMFAAVALVGVHPAGASFPGKNGKIAYTRVTQITTMESDGGKKQTITHIGPQADAEAPQSSADGRWIVFDAVSPSGGSDFEIYVVRWDGSHLRRITHNDSYDWAPSFSPNGKKIVFSDTAYIYVMRRNGTHVRQLSDGGDDEWPRFSPNGNLIVFNSARAGDNDIWVMNAKGGNEHAVLDNAANDRYPDWSPSGTRIGFSSDLDGDLEVWVMRRHPPETDHDRRERFLQPGLLPGREVHRLLVRGNRPLSAEPEDRRRDPPWNSERVRNRLAAGMNTRVFRTVDRP